MSGYHDAVRVMAKTSPLDALRLLGFTTSQLRVLAISSRTYGDGAFADLCDAEADMRAMLEKKEKRVPEPGLTNDENRMALCGDVIDAYREDGLGLERALAMLYKLTDPAVREPYLADRPTAGGDGFIVPPESLAAYLSDLSRRALRSDPESDDPTDVALDMATHQWSDDLESLEELRAYKIPGTNVEVWSGDVPRLSADAKCDSAFDDGLGPLPTAEEALSGYTRRCPICGEPLIRRPRESHKDFAERKTDSRRCSAQLRELEKRAAREAREEIEVPA